MQSRKVQKFKKTKMAQKHMHVPYAFSMHGEKEIDAVVSVLRGNTANAGNTEKFEKSIARLFGKKFGVMVNSGSSANLLAFEIADLPKGSEVITPALTFATTVAPILQKGLKPVFVDVEKDTYVVSVMAVERAITKRTKAMIIPSLIGNLPDLEALQKIARKHKLLFIEDSCDTLGARYNRKPSGVFSDISTTSFYGSHIINAAGGGGLISVNDPAWRERLKVLRGWGRLSSKVGESKESEDIDKRFAASVDDMAYDMKFVFSEIGYNFLPLELSAAFGLVQLEKLAEFRARRKKNFLRLTKYFGQFKEYFILPKEHAKTDTAWLAFPVTIRSDAPFDRRELATALELRGIQTRPIFTGNILRQPAFRSILGEHGGKYAVADDVMRGGMLLGCHQGLNNDQLSYMEEVIDEFITQKKSYGKHKA